MFKHVFCISCLIQDSLQKDFGIKTGEMLWNHSRGIDNRLVGVIQVWQGAYLLGFFTSESNCFFVFFLTFYVYVCHIFLFCIELYIKFCLSIFGFYLNILLLLPCCMVFLHFMSKNLFSLIRCSISAYDCYLL